MRDSTQVRYCGAMRPASSRPNKQNRDSTNAVGSGTEWIERAADLPLVQSSKLEPVINA